MYDRKQIMLRAWELFRKTYNYPQTPFKSIGRRCFACCLKNAWNEARNALKPKPAPLTGEQIRERIWVLEGASLNMRVSDQISALRDQLRQIERIAA